MDENKPTYEELEARLTEAEERLKTVRSEKIDALIGRKGASLPNLQDMDQALKNSKDELEERVCERTAELERSNRELLDFAYIASHDLQEPLRKIRTFGEMLVSRDRDALSKEGLDYLKRMQNAAHRMQKLIDALLTYSRVETRFENFSAVDLRQVTEEVLDILEVRIADADARVDLEALPTVKADRSQMYQLFQNLIGNSLKFHRKNENLVIRIYSQSNSDENPEQPMKTICVADNGIGFDEVYVQQIFRPFERLHGGNAEYEGVGMGLAICRKIVERHGGTITAESSPGNGATFFVTLPQNNPGGKAGCGIVRST